jgi:O-antigen ligase
MIKNNLHRVDDRAGLTMSASVARIHMAKRAEEYRMPVIVPTILIFTVIACIGGESIFGYQLSGLSWFIPLILALVLLIPRIDLIRLPVVIWIPWVLFVIGQWLYSSYPSIQRTVQLLTPLIIGAVVSTYEINEYHAKRFLSLMKNLSVALLVLVVLKAGIHITGRLPGTTGLAPEVMTVMLLCSVIGAEYLMGSKKALALWSLLAAVPVVALTRTAIIVTGLTIPLNLAPMKMRNRIVWLAVICVVGVIIFYTPRMQVKMFQQGEGGMSDVVHKDFSDSGRFYMWERMKAGVSESPWFGHGTGAGEAFVRKLTFGISGYPHNDWLLTEYDFGIVGVVLYALTLFMAGIHALKKGRAAEGTAKTLFLAGASSFIFYAMMMYTDNIMVYTSFFGNLHFTVLGIAYATDRTTRPQIRSKRRIRW